MVRRHHPVLAQISLCYSEPLGRFPRVTHPCATNPEGFVRLACVRHAASVRSEPGSNSQVCVTTRQARTEVRRPARLSFKEPIPALVKRNGYEGHVSSQRRRGAHEGCGIGIRLPVSGALSSPDRAPSPTCPFIKNQQFQRATDRKKRTTSGPRFCYRGTAVRLCWRPGSVASR